MGGGAKKRLIRSPQLDDNFLFLICLLFQVSHYLLIKLSDMEQQYKRQDRAVSPETAKKISDSLKSYNAAHPRGTVSSGSAWAKSIQQGTMNYWNKIPPKADKTKIEDIML